MNDAFPLNEKTRLIIAQLEKTRHPKIDDDMLPLVNAINLFLGVMSGENCVGHGLMFPHLEFYIDGSPESLNGLGIISHVAGEYDWAIFVSNRGILRGKTIHFVLCPKISFSKANSENNFNLFMGRSSDKSELQIEVNKILLIGNKIQFLSRNDRSGFSQALGISIPIRFPSEVSQRFNENADEE